MKGRLLFAPIVILGSLITTLASQSPKQAKPDTPWEELRNDLSSPDILNLPSVSDWKMQCLDPMVFTEPFSTDPFKLYGYDIGYTPAGVCMIHLGCMYKGCSSPLNVECPSDEQCMDFNRLREPPFDSSNLYEDLMELPAAVLHPQSASDVVRGIEFAKKHDVGISVKVVGHSYMGASTNRGTLLIKMSTNYPVYSEGGSLTECTGDDTRFSDADRMACTVATARGKKAFIRVGGGELFDTAYRAVFFDWNENPANANQYHFVGGYCGTVSAAGGWMHSGGLSGASMRLHGVGVDQVLQIEMVLPHGTHIRFGPSSWEQQEGFEIPKTTEVTGHCNAKPHETDESMWEWTSCEEEGINFEDLWFAVRGGGGGTFGIVTSLYYQLHDKPGSVQVVAANDPEFSLRSDTEKDSVVAEDYIRFILQYFYLPETLQNVTELESRSCNAAGGSFWNIPYYSILQCHNSAGNKFVDAWKKYLETSKLRQKYGDDQDFMTSMNSLFAVIDEKPSQGYISVLTEGPYKGRIKDDDGVTLESRVTGSFEHVPLYTVQTYFDDLVRILVEDIMAGVFDTFYLMGGAVPLSSDQMNSMGPLRRNAAFAKFSQIPVIDAAGNAIGNTESYKKFYELIWRDTNITDSTNFPGIFCHNHAGNQIMGPLKTDWTEPCPSILEATQAEREEICVSQPESFWGTRNTDRLVDIKKNVDPNGLFICNAGIEAMSPLHDDAFAKKINENPGPSTVDGEEVSDNLPNQDGIQNSQAVSTFNWRLSFSSLVSAIWFFI